MPLDPELKKMLRCPKCKSVLILEDQEAAFRCPACKLRYVVENGVPNFLIAEAKPVQE